MPFIRQTCLLIISLLLASPAAAVNTGWQVTDSVEIEPEKEFVLLSPDGTWLFELTPREPDEICIRHIATFAAACDGISAGFIELRSVTWAPDSSAVAFAINWHKSGIESDIFIQDAETGTITNLTDDDVEEYQERRGTSPIMDVHPAWTPDSKALLFQRTSLDHPGHPLMWIGREGGEPEVFTTLPAGIAPILSAPVHLADNGTLYFSTLQDKHEPRLQHGVFRLTVDGTVESLVPGTGDIGLTSILIDVAPDGGFLIASNPDSDPAPDAPVFLLVETTTAEILPIGGSDASAAEPVFLPDGSGVLAAIMSEDESAALAVMDLEGTMTELHRIPAAEDRKNPTEAGTPWVFPSLAWAENNVILARSWTTPTVLLEVHQDTPPGSPAPNG